MGDKHGRQAQLEESSPEETHPNALGAKGPQAQKPQESLTQQPELKPGEIFIPGVGVIEIRGGRGQLKGSAAPGRKKQKRDPPDYKTPLFTQFKAMGLPLPEPEYQFHRTRKWKFDFAWPGLKVALEVEGGTWLAKGGHNHPGDFLNDMDKYNEAAIDGWWMLRVTPEMVPHTDGRAAFLVERMLKART